MATRPPVPASLRTFDLPLFLTPAFAECRAASVSRRSFSAFPAQRERHNRERNKKRGVSAIRSTGTRVPLRVDRFDLPVPVENPERRKYFKTDPNHGLWGFFNSERRPMITPEEEAAYGRPWNYQELSVKDWEDLYKLYWTCIKDWNRATTRAHEMHRLRAGYGEGESNGRVQTIKHTMKNIRAVLKDRHINYTQARNILEAHDDVREVLEEHVEEEPAEDPVVLQDSRTPEAEQPRSHQAPL